MAGFSIHTRIAAPVERVFAIFTDFEKAPERIAAIAKVEMLTSGAVREGTRFLETRVLGGRRATEELTVTRFEPRQGYAVACQSHGCHFSTACLFYPLGSSATTVEIAFAAEPQNLMAKLKLAVLLPAIRREFERDLQALKSVAEREAATG